MNYYITLYIIKDEERKVNYLVYGFIINTELSIEDRWRESRLDKKLKLYRLTNIVSLITYNKFIDNFNEFNIDGFILEGNFLERGKLISGISYTYEKNKPTNKLSNLEEYWNVDKESLLENIKNLYSDDLVDDRIKELLNILYEKIAIRFREEPYRFGNLEVYKIKKYNDFFNFKFQDNNTLFKVYIEEPLSIDIYVKLYSENNNRVILNKLKTLKKGNTEVTFKLNENSYHALLEIWNQDGELIYFNNTYYMRSLYMHGKLMGNKYNVSDNWSESLKKSTNHNLYEIEEVNPVKSSINTNIDPQYKLDYIYKTISDTSNLFDDYNSSITKGRFIFNKSNRKGEIDSYKLVKELIDSNKMSRVIIMDPYFSTTAVSKILGRIENKNIRIEIITSLTEVDSDTGIGNENYKEYFKNYILENKNLLHENLKITNVLSGKNEAFHDRYIIRFFKDKTQDGYILSNSINSMGQTYPFLASPLEKNIVNAIYIYLEMLLGNEESKELYYKKLSREIIYNNDHNKKKSLILKTYILPYILTGITNEQEALKVCLDKEYILDEKLRINNEKYKEIIDIILNKWTEDKNKVIKSIGELLYNSTLYTIKIDKYILGSLEIKDIDEKEFIKELKILIKDIEKSVDIPSYRIDTIEKELYLILNGNASMNIKHVYNNPKNLFYGSYLRCLYRLLYEYSFEEYIKLLEEIKSPMMFTKLVKNMNFSDFNIRQYKILIESEIPYVDDLTGYWLLDTYLQDNIPMKKMLEIINGFSDYNRLNQGCTILSELIFQYRRGYNINKEELNNFIKELSVLFNNSYKSIDDQIKCIKKFKDIDLKNDIKFKIIILNNLEKKELKDYIVRDLINRFIFYYKNNNNLFNIEYDGHIINYFLEVLNI